MKVIGGSFGANGKAVVVQGEAVAISSTLKAEYPFGDVERFSAEEEKQRKFGALGCIVGAILLAFILTPFLGLLGLILAVVVAVVGSFYTKTENLARLDFVDGRQVLLSGDRREIEQLTRSIQS